MNPSKWSASPPPCIIGDICCNFLCNFWQKKKNLKRETINQSLIPSAFGAVYCFQRVMWYHKVFFFLHNIWALNPTSAPDPAAYFICRIFRFRCESDRETFAKTTRPPERANGFGRSQRFLRLGRRSKIKKLSDLTGKECCQNYCAHWWSIEQ